MADEPTGAFGVCTMCEQAPATTTWGFPVCRPCAEALYVLQGDLEAMEAEDPHLADLGRKVEEAAAAFFAAPDQEVTEPCPACDGVGHQGPGTGARQRDYGRACRACDGTGRKRGTDG